MVTVDGKTGDISCGILRLSDIAIGGRDGQVCCYTQTENIKHFAERVVNECTVRMLSGCAIASRHWPRNFAHAHLSIS